MQSKDYILYTKKIEGEFCLFKGGRVEIKLKALITILTTKIIIKTSKILFKGGTNFPGRLALRLDTSILKTVSKGYKVILVTGTNGKTTTTSMIYNSLKNAGFNVITNGTGANLYTGVVSCFVENFKFNKSNCQRYAVIEIDEANLKFVTTHLCPEIITITNLFRDQLDRFGEIYTTLKKILEGVEKVPSSRLVLNGDESLLGDLPEHYANPCSYYGFNTAVESNKTVDINADAKFCKKCKSTYSYDFITYNHLGSYYCPNCDYKRPTLDYQVENILETTPSGSTVTINNHEVYINQPGIYNIYNALCAYSIAKLCGVSDEILETTLRSQESSFGRQEIVSIKGKSIKIVLVKNPAGYDQAIKTISLDKGTFSMGFLLNDNYADGRDVSWIWDVNFEELSLLNIEKVSVSGIRLYDMAIRLKIAGINEASINVLEAYDSFLQSILDCESETVYILATYTAMISFRKFLNGKGYIKKLW